MRKSLDILKQITKIDIDEIPSGTKCYDWIIPDEWNIKDAFVEDEIQRFTLSISSKAVRGSISANTGVAPLFIMDNTVSNAVIEVVITSSPGPMPRVRTPIASAAIPFPTPTAYGTSQSFAQAFSKF